MAVCAGQEEALDEMIQHIDHFPLFDVAGPPYALPIVLAHGAAWTRSMWLPQMEVLSDEFRVTALDLPGYGALRGKPFRLESAVQAVIESLSRETHERALVVGLSLLSSLAGAR